MIAAFTSQPTCHAKRFNSLEGVGPLLVPTQVLSQSKVQRVECNLTQIESFQIVVQHPMEIFFCSRQILSNATSTGQTVSAFRSTSFNNVRYAI